MLGSLDSRSIEPFGGGGVEQQLQMKSRRLGRQVGFEEPLPEGGCHMTWPFWYLTSSPRCSRRLKMSAEVFCRKGSCFKICIHHQKGSTQGEEVEGGRRLPDQSPEVQRSQGCKTFKSKPRSTPHHSYPFLAFKHPST